MSHIMIDLETLSLRTKASVLIVAAVRFNPTDRPDGGNAIRVKNEDIFYRRITRESCEQLNLDICAATLVWWAEQNIDVLAEAFSNEDAVSVRQALQELAVFVGNDKRTCVWSHGAPFDIPILSELYARLEMRVPWQFYNVRDTRTLFDLADVKKLPQTNKHNALNDCHNQIWGVNTALVRLEAKQISSRYRYLGRTPVGAILNTVIYGGLMFLLLAAKIRINYLEDISASCPINNGTVS